MREEITLPKQVHREEEILLNTYGLAWKEASGPLTHFGPFCCSERGLSKIVVSFHSDYSLSVTHSGGGGSVGMISEIWGLFRRISLKDTFS